MTNRSLPDAFFKPGTVAVVGASKKAMFSSGIPDTLVKYGYRDRVYLVNPRETEINGMPVYARLADIPAPVDLAIVVVPATQAPIVVRECVKLGIPAVVLESAGFGETGPEGARLEEELRRLLRGARTRVIGPNCLGVINPHESFATTPVDLKALRPGNIGVIAQSGTFGNILADWAPTQDLYFSKLVTIGNRLDVDETDCLLYFAEDAQTDVIVLYLEGVKDGRRFYEATREVSRRKPVLVYKGGRSPAGRMAAASHTGSLTGEDELYDAIFRQSGVTRAASFQELFEMARVFSREPLLTGPRICVVTASGSLGVMMADACMTGGLELPGLSPETVSVLRELAPAWMNVKNPLDVGPSGIFAAAMKAVAADPRIDGIIAVPVFPEEILRRFAAMGIDTRSMNGDPREWRNLAPDKPFLMFTVGGPSWLESIRKTYGPAVSLVGSPEIAARSLAALYRYSSFRARG
ncbi:MAG TPA: CoA-binding protein [Syntrophales bacterium]|nr:CoA-binding protein [Syntrophales bacterium]HPB69729.1 CoA-binding protein [Syntrophales bacterium]HQN24943.1 CoA-binding protein [Syntrophales bacterium]HQP28653.1 CoA-binding protein [Syntrophales bacterium]